MNLKDLNELLTSDDFLSKYQEYIKQNNHLLDNFEFLNNLEINKNYYKLNIFNKKDDIKIKTINGLLNKLSDMNLTTTIQHIIHDVRQDTSLLNLTIDCLIEKCILQQQYANNYVSILQSLDKEFHCKHNIKTYIDSYDILFNFEKNEEIEDGVRKQYELLCEKNKKTDNFIGYCFAVYKLETNQLISQKYESMLHTIVELIQKNKEENKYENVYKYICCLYTIVNEESKCQSWLRETLTELKQQIRDKKTVFKIMDILDIN